MTICKGQELLADQANMCAEIREPRNPSGEVVSPPDPIDTSVRTRYDSILGTTVPPTSVSRKSRPMCR